MKSQRDLCRMGDQQRERSMKGDDGEEVSVDVVIPAYNASRFIGEALESVASQSYLPARVIVVDDGSLDDTASVVERFRRVHPELDIVILSQPNHGLSAARNTGISSAISPWVALLDADDVWEPLKLEKQIRQLRNTTLRDVGVVYCDYSLIDDNSDALHESRFILNPDVRGDVRLPLRQGNYIAGSGSAVVVRRVLFDRVGLFDVSLCSAEDWDMWIRLAEVTSFDYVNEPLVKIRRHISSMQRNHGRMLEGELMLLNKLVSGGLHPIIVYRLRREAALYRINVVSLECYPMLDSNLKSLFMGWRFELFAVYVRTRHLLSTIVRRVFMPRRLSRRS